MKPFADICRPKTIEEMVGQEHLVTKDKILYNLIKNGNIPNMILYGPPGTGKTTLANIIANETKKGYIKLNATDCGVKDLKTVILQSKKEEGLILYVDEFHLLNKKQQQSLLEVLENGKVILIASTTENPYFSVYKAIISRCSIFEFKPISTQHVEKRLNDILPVITTMSLKKLVVEDGVLSKIANLTNGDLRSAINLFELLYFKNISNNIIEIKLSDFEDLALSKFRLDKDGDEHYNCLSAFHKSLRGSDENAAIHYLARLIKVGDIQSICRRLLCVASEDVGLANPMAVAVVKSCVDSALQLGFPEARLPLAEATIFLAKQPKSNAAYIAINTALEELDAINCGDIPEHLKDAHYAGAKDLNHGVEYKYPHNYENHYVKQQYLPNEIKDHKYYISSNTKIEESYEQYWKNIKGDDINEN